MTKVGLAFLSVLLLSTVALAGCSSGDDDATTAPTSGETTGPRPTGTTSRPTGTGTQTQTEQPTTGTTSAGQTSQEPGAPTPTFSVETVGVNSTFTVGGTDPDGADLSYTLRFGDGSPDATGEGKASGFSEQVSHMYSAGIYTAVLTVSNGDQSSTLQLAVNATAPSGGDPIVMSCSMLIGALVVGISGTVGSCIFGTTDTPTALSGVEVPASCTANYKTGEAQGVETYSQATVGDEYPAGTKFAMFCQATAGANPTGTIELMPV